MDLAEILDDTLELIGLPGLLLFCMLLMGALWRWRHPPADPAEAEARRTPVGVWFLIVALAVGFVRLDSAVASRWPAARWWLVPAYLVLVVAVMILVVFWPRRDAYLLAWRVRRGDIAGAIAALEARVARTSGLDSADAPPSPPDDPWTAPASASRSASSRRTLANRCNMLGTLEAQRDDWARALAWFERAEQAGGGVREVSGNMGAALVRVGRVAEGLALIRAALDGLPPAGNRPLRAQVTLQLAGALIRAGQLAEARTRLDQAEAEVDRFPALLARARPPYRTAARTLRDRLAAADFPTPADSPTPA